jgi:hypothetical protein
MAFATMLTTFVLSLLAAAPEAPAPAAATEAVAPTASAASSAPASAEPAQAPAKRVVLNSLTIVRWNPLGLEEQIRFGYQRRLYDADKAVSRDNFVFLGLTPKINPAYIKAGPALELQPLSVMNLRLTAEYISFFSTFGFLQSKQAPTANYSDTTLARGKDAKENYSTGGAHLMGELLLQAKVGKVVVRNRLAVEYWKMNLKGTDRVWYDATLDTLVPGDGWVVDDDADVLYQPGNGLTVGLRYSFVEPLYATAGFRPDEIPAESNGHHRLGPLIAYTFYEDNYSTFNKPSVLLIANWYLASRWRTGADVSRAVPYLVLGFAFQSDFLTPGGLADAR